MVTYLICSVGLVGVTHPQNVYLACPANQKRFAEIELRSSSADPELLT